MEHQINQLHDMVETDRECADVLQQMASIRATLESLGSLVLREHVGEVVTSAPEAASTAGTQKQVDDVHAAISKLVQ